MRKLFSLFAAMLVALAVNAKVWTVGPNHNEESDRTDCNLYVTLDRLAQAGDTILLADGTYDEPYSASIKNNVVIMAAEGATPLVQLKGYLDLKANAEVIGVKFQFVGDAGNGYGFYIRENTPKFLKLEGCEFFDYPKYCVTGSSSSAHCDSVLVNNCYFHDCANGPFYFPASSLPDNVNLCDKLEVTNSTFANIDVVGWVSVIDLRNNSSSTAATSKLVVDHCTFYNCQGDYERMIQSYKSPDVQVTNCIMMNPVIEGKTEIYAVYVYGGSVHHNLNYQTKRQYVSGGSVSDTICRNPQFVNAAEGNLTLGEGSPALTAAEDGGALGDPRWWPAPYVPEMKTIYCKMDKGWWKADGAAVGIYAWDGDVKNANWPGERMTPVEGEADLWSFELDINTYKNCIFTRVNASGNIEDWGAKTANLTIPTDDNDLFTITSETAVWGDPGCTGAWSKYAPAVGCDWDNLSWIAGSNNKLKVCLGDPAPSVVSVQNPHWSETTEDGIYMTFPAAAWGDISLPASKYEKQGAGILLFVSAFDLKYTDVSIVESNVEYNFTVYNADGDDVVYNVAGQPETVFGSTWNTYANKMTLEEGIYKLEKTELLLTAGDIKFKVVKNHDWATSWPSSDYVLNVAEDGIYTVTISYNPEGNVVNATATKTGEAVVLPVVKMHGNFFGEEWEDSEAFAEATDKKSASLTLPLAKGSYKFGMKFDGSWTSNGVAFTRANPSAEVVAGSGDLTLAADVAGDYTFTWTYETNTLSIAYPVKYYEYATGHLNNPDFGDASGRILLTLSKSGNDIVVTIKNNNAKGNPQTGLNFLQVSAVGATTVTYGSHETENTETVSVKVKFDAPKDSYTFSSIHWAYAGWNGEWAIDGLTVPASQICELEDGYYLVGTFGGVEAWDLDDLSAEKRFEANPGTDGEYMLTATLAENDNLKVVKVINDAYGPWYPATDPNYVVGADYVGVKTIYFRPNGDGGEGWHYGYIYIAPSIPTAIDNADAELKATKRIENGQLFIEFNGVRYNVIGAKVR